MNEHVKPNIVLICVDQMRGDAMSGAGHPVVRTPWIDSLASGGTTFEPDLGHIPLNLRVTAY